MVVVKCDVRVMWGRLVKCDGPLLRSNGYDLPA